MAESHPTNDERSRAAVATPTAADIGSQQSALPSVDNPRAGAGSSTAGEDNTPLAPPPQPSSSAEGQGAGGALAESGDPYSDSSDWDVPATEGSDEDEPQHDDDRAEGRPTCRCRAVPRLVRCAILRRRQDDQYSLHRLLSLYGRLACAEGVSFCARHVSTLAARMGLRTRDINQRRLETRLLHLHRHRSNLGVVRSARNTATWFRSERSRAGAGRALAPYAWYPPAPTPFTFDPRLISRHLGPGAAIGVPMDLRRKFTRDGILEMDGVFSWWWESGLVDEMKREFDVYLHHARIPRSGRMYGWLRNMFHSLSQQMAQQDPALYRMICMLRPDQQTEFISYPYYTRYCTVGDLICYRHIDINVRRALSEGRGASVVKCVISLDDDDDGRSGPLALRGLVGDNLADWYGRVRSRRKIPSGQVTVIRDEDYDEDDVDRYQADWQGRPEASKGGFTQFIHGLLPTGWEGPCTSPQRVLMPWLIGIQPDGETLEIPECGTWSEVSAAHRDLTLPPTSPTGRPFCGSRLPFAFPPAIRLNGISPISDALMGLARWTSPAVMLERSILLGPDQKQADHFIQQWRYEAMRLLPATIDAFFKREARMYQHLSEYAVRMGLSARAADDACTDELNAELAREHMFERPLLREGVWSDESDSGRTCDPLVRDGNGADNSTGGPGDSAAPPALAVGDDKGSAAVGASGPAPTPTAESAAHC